MQLPLNLREVHCHLGRKKQCVVQEAETSGPGNGVLLQNAFQAGGLSPAPRSMK